MSLTKQYPNIKEVAQIKRMAHEGMELEKVAAHLFIEVDGVKAHWPTKEELTKAKKDAAPADKATA